MSEPKMYWVKLHHGRGLWHRVEIGKRAALCKQPILPDRIREENFNPPEQPPGPACGPCGIVAMRYRLKKYGRLTSTNS